MIEEILPNLYKLEIPLPQNPLRAVNSYLIKAAERSLIIDTGMNREECRHAMLSNLKRLDVDLKKTDFFITHIHIDHLGLVPTLVSETSTVYFNRQEASSIDFQKHWQISSKLYQSNGFPQDELQNVLEAHPGHRYKLMSHIDFHIMDEGSTIEIEDYCFRCIATPGHSSGHMCLYENKKRLLVSGDHLLFDISPNIFLGSDEKNPLKEYLASLDKIYALEANLILPGHGRIFNDHRKRIIELKHHHQARANEMLSILDGGEKNAYQISSLMSWDVEYSSWELFPSFQKWFALGETLAHLKYLEEDGLVRKKRQNNKIVFSTAPPGPTLSIIKTE